jgi:hypothetical protein
VALLSGFAELDFSRSGCNRRPYRKQTGSRGNPPLIRPPIV